MHRLGHWRIASLDRGQYAHGPTPSRTFCNVNGEHAPDELSLAARGRSLEGRVTAKRSRILGGDYETMLIHWEESATTKTAPFRRNPLGSGGGGPQALSFVGHDVKMAPAASVIGLGGRSSLRACNPKTPARDPRDFCHGLLVARTRARSGASGLGDITQKPSPASGACTAVMICGRHFVDPDNGMEQRAAWYRLKTVRHRLLEHALF
jgi:hypothetical protein